MIFPLQNRKFLKAISFLSIFFHVCKICHFCWMALTFIDLQLESVQWECSFFTLFSWVSSAGSSLWTWNQCSSQSGSEIGNKLLRHSMMHNIKMKNEIRKTPHMNAAFHQEEVLPTIFNFLFLHFILFFFFFFALGCIQGFEWQDTHPIYADIISKACNNSNIKLYHGCSFQGQQSNQNKNATEFVCTNLHSWVKSPKPCSTLTAVVW